MASGYKSERLSLHRISACELVLREDLCLYILYTRYSVSSSSSQIRWAGRAKVPRKATNLALVVRPTRRSATADGVVGDSETALLVGLVQAHVDPRPGRVMMMIFYLFLQKQKSAHIPQGYFPPYEAV
jgi:hypothetical protein